MQFKSVLLAIAFSLLGCFPAQAGFFPAATTKKGWIEVDTDSIQHLDNGTARFLSREVESGSVTNANIELVDCWNQRAMFLAQYNFDAQMWIQNPNPRWYSIAKSSTGRGLQIFVCSQP